MIRLGVSFPRSVRWLLPAMLLGLGLGACHPGAAPTVTPTATTPPLATVTTPPTRVDQLSSARPAVSGHDALTATATPVASPTATATVPTATGTAAPATATATSPALVATPTAHLPATTPTLQGSLPGVASEITVPPGFHAWRWGEVPDPPTALAWGPDGRLYVATLNGAIMSFGGDAQSAERPVTVATGLVTPLGLAFEPATHGLYVSRLGGVDRLVDADGDGQFEGRDKVLDGLSVGRHSTDDVEFGPDGKLYVATGSVDDMGESGQRPQLQAGILRLNADGSDLELYASGLRNPYGLAFDAAGQLWATDNGGDVPEGQPDELNRIEQGGDYGWPGCFGVGQASVPGACEGTLAPVVTLASHSSSDGLTVYTDRRFPAAYQGAIFIAQWGSAFADKPAGQQVVVVYPGDWTVQPFATGFAHPLDVLVDPRDGALWVADFGRADGRSGGVLYKVGWWGP